MRNRLLTAGAGLFAALFLTVAGCQPEDKRTPSKGRDGYGDGPGGAVTTGQAKKGKHDAWWCKEHGIPEHECLMCLHSEEELKKKGDWCEKHEYAKSQCFACNPKLKEQYAAKYRAKYGKEPPEPEDNPVKPNPEEKKDADKKDEKK